MFEVIVTINMFGGRVPLFEPIHGRPKYTGKDIANPTAID